MADSADDLILKIQHLGAQAKASLEAGRLRVGLDRLKTAAQRLALKEQIEVATLEKREAEAEAEMETLSGGGLKTEGASAYVAARQRAEETKRQLVRARAALNFALDKMSEAERREFEAVNADLRAEIHGDLANDAGQQS